MTDENTFQIHYTIDLDKNGMANYHTHGLREHYDHPDFQIVLPISSKIVVPIFHQIMGMIKGGKRFEAGVDYDDILRDGYLVRMIGAIEDNREVLRIIFPDKSGNLGPDQDNTVNIQYRDFL
jgi:hypothetical protein